jgi:para-nitrobenzyl esterase
LDSVVFILEKIMRTVSQLGRSGVVIASVALLLASANAHAAVPSGVNLATPANMPAAQASTTVKIDTGTLEGKIAGDVLSFKGIPYAAPPVSNLRWRAPQPAAPWTDVRQATAFGSDCAQAPGDFEPLKTKPSEDCLFVNVWRPATITGSAKLPVLVWIHGGGFVGGGTSVPFYDGSAFARQGIVVVSMNYRLGRFGFFAHPALLKAKEGPVGNFGFMDQIAALQWVKRNVGAFGGDPNKVTIVGESAGGASVLTLLTSPAAKGLFHGAMIMSGGGRVALISRKMTGGILERKTADKVDAEFAESLGIRGNGPEALASLRALSPEAIYGELNLNAVLADALLGDQSFAGGPMIDGTTVVASPAEIFARGEQARVPVIVGTTAADLPLTFPPLKIFPFTYFGSDSDKAKAAYNAPEKLDRDTLVPILLSISMDLTMHEPARFVAREVTAAGDPAWLYRFTYTADSTRPESLKPGQSHAGELPFMFNTLEAKYGDAVTPADREVAVAFNTYVSNFVKTGDPNGGALPDWPKFDSAKFDLLNFTFDDGPVFGADPRAARVELVERATDARTK